MGTGPVLPPPGIENGWHDAFVRRLLAAFTRATGRDLALDLGAGQQPLGRFFYDGDFALLSHRGDADAILNYGNARALALWNCDWARFTAMASRQTAPQAGRASREAMMAKVKAEGFVQGYQGERVSLNGRRFLICDTTIWRLQDGAGEDFGIAAFVPRVVPL